jgi:hypothetical protein
MLSPMVIDGAAPPTELPILLGTTARFVFLYHVGAR